MKLYVMRHGDAADGLDDKVRPLSAQGVREAENAGRFLARIREVPDVVRHSPLLRATQTAEAVARVLCSLCSPGPRVDVRECAGILPGDDPEDFLRGALAFGQREGLLVVTHQPFVSDLVSLLLAGERGVGVKFSTGTIAGFERSASFGRWTLRFHLTAKAIARL